MSSSTSPSKSSRRAGAGAKTLIRRDVSKETVLSDHSGSTLDPDSSFASSSAMTTQDWGTNAAVEEKSKRGSLIALGAKVRSFSSAPRRMSVQKDKTESPSSLPRARGSRSSLLLDDSKGGEGRGMKLLDAFRNRHHSPNTSSVDFPKDQMTKRLEERAYEEQPKQDTLPRPVGPRLSMHSLSSLLQRSAPTQSPEAAPSVLPSESNGQGEFNLRAFRNVRRDSSTNPYFPPSTERPAKSNSIPMSSASQYTLSHSPPLRQDSFLSAEEYLPISSGLSPRSEVVSPYEEVSISDISPGESKPSSPRLDPARIQGGSISAGRFRRVASHGTSSPIGGSSTPTDRWNRPASPFVNLTASPSATLAALEAELARGRTTPLLFMQQGEEAQRIRSSPSAQSNADNLNSPTKDSYFTPRGSLNIPAPEAAGKGPTLGQPETNDSDADKDQDMAPPIRPWVPAKSHLRRNAAHGASSTGATKEVGLALVDAQLTTPTLKSKKLSASPEQGEQLLMDDRDQDKDNDWIPSKPPVATRKGHQRGNSIPVVRAVPKTSIHHRRAASSHMFEGIQSNASPWTKAEELLSFHRQQAASLSAAQERKEIEPTHAARIAWPAPPCVKADYFSRLTALHQHSLYEQHRKAAEHALAEYLKLMAGVVPANAMIPPGPLFSSDRRPSHDFFVNGHGDARRSPSRRLRSRSFSAPSGQASSSAGGSLRNPLRLSRQLDASIPPVPILPSTSALSTSPDAS